MSQRTDYRVHHCASFELVAQEDTSDFWPDVVRKIRGWIKTKERNRGVDADWLVKPWFFLGGQWGERGSTVVTQSIPGSGSVGLPQYWAVRYEETDGTIKQRRWRTDIGLTVLSSERLAVSVTISHFLMPGFMGEEPDLPAGNSPGITKDLIRARKWKAVGGTEVLGTYPRSLRLGDIPALKQRLEDPLRTAPIIVVSARRDTADDYLVDPGRLAWNSAGSASLCTVPSTDEVSGEAKYFIPYRYRCSNGVVRVYMPGVDFGSDHDHLRHRFFHAEYCEDRGAQTVEGMILAGLARRLPHRYPHQVFTIEDVVERERGVERRRLRAQLQDAVLRDDVEAQKQWSDYVLEENDKLEDQLRQIVADLQAAETRASDLEVTLQAEIDEQDGAIRGLEFRERQAHERADRAETQVREQGAVASVLEELDEFPDSLSDALSFAADVYSGRLIILDEAKESAKGYDFDVDRAWRALRCMALQLHRLHFDTQSADIERDFRDATGLELALSEGKLTKQMKQAKRERKRTYRGAEIDITPHVKVDGRPSGRLRIHYHADHENRVIVVGHCGDHLTTAGTQKIN